MIEFKKFSTGKSVNKVDGFDYLLFDPYKDKTSTFFSKKDMQGTICKDNKHNENKVIILSDIEQRG